MFFFFILLLTFMSKKWKCDVRASVRLCSLGPISSLPGWFRNKVPRVFFKPSLQKYYFKKHRPQCPGKLYLWDFVCQESQSKGQPKKRGLKKDYHVANIGDFMIERNQPRRSSQLTWPYVFACVIPLVTLQEKKIYIYCIWIFHKHSFFSQGDQASSPRES